MKLATDNLFFEWMGRLGDYMLLNFCFLISSLPIVTIGASTAAMYRMIFKMQEGRAPYVVRSYFACFREEFKKATAGFLCLGLSACVLGFDIWFSARQNGQIWIMLGAAAGVLLVFCLFTLSFLFAVQARFENSFSGTLKNALLMSLRHLFCTIPVLVLDLLPVILWFVNVNLLGMLIPLYLVVGFAGIAYVKGLLFAKAFTPYTVH